MKQKHLAGGLAALVLFGIFAGCLLAVLFTGADTYRRITERDRSAYEQRICAQYLAARVRQADSPACVTLEPFGDGQALVLAEETGGERYLTRLYFCDGYLMELYCAASADLSPRDGVRVMAAGGLHMELTDGLLRVEVQGTDGGQVRLALSLADGRGAAG